MPNGAGKNWCRLLIIIEAFYARYKQWPSKMAIPANIFDDLGKHIFTPESFDKLQKRINVVRTEREFAASDERGNKMSYDEASNADALEYREMAVNWIGVLPDHPHVLRQYMHTESDL
jgi:hypothetical protein